MTSAYSLAVGSVVDVLRDFRDNSFDAIMCDPPYGLSFMGKKWDYDVPSVETWRECMRVLKPGAPLVAFGGSRTYHRLACGIEDAGAIPEDQISWLYAQGKPSSRRLKPSHENILVARKSGLALALNVNDCKIGVLGRWPGNVVIDDEVSSDLDVTYGEHKSAPFRENVAVGSVLPFERRTAGGYSDTGGVSRYFFCAKASTAEREEGLGELECLEMEFTTWDDEGLRVRLLVATEASAPRVMCVSGMSASSVSEWNTWLFGNATSDLSPPAFRFTTRTKTSSITESKIWRLSRRLNTSASTPAANSATESGGSLAQCAEPSSLLTENTGISPKRNGPRIRGASPVTLCELFARSKSAVVWHEAPSHPCIKPLSLTTWLARLICPPNPGVILVPFAGAGSEMIGALRAGWGGVFGIEREAEYVEIARARLRKWCPESEAA